MASVPARRKRSLSSHVRRLIPFGSLAGLTAIMAIPPETNFILAGLFGAGAAYTGARLVDRRVDRRKELARRAGENVAELKRVAREDRKSAPQMKRIRALQDGVLESWELLPGEYRPLLDEDIFTIVGEVEGTARLARRRAALRRHLESVDLGGIRRRIEGLEKDLASLEPGSATWTAFESALDGRRGELENHADILEGISVINAQLEGAESLLGNLRGELLALDTSLGSPSMESGLVHLRERVSYFRKGLDQVTRAVEPLPENDMKQVTTR
ncbi:MAG: hypothetical protein M3397_04695 [Actinomycetota bacterium]|nr:hypothetical protein [Actinomycetota bacterium]MDQ3567363.1 hypothetical protein [Actinomycetota bacterium]